MCSPGLFLEATSKGITMFGNSFYRTLSNRTICALLGAALICSGCAAEHKKFATPAKQDWEKAQLGIMYQVAEQEYKVGDYDKCRDGLAKMLEVKASFAPMHILMAKVDLEGGSLDDAASQLKTAAAIAPNDPEPYYLLGVVYQRWQKFDTAADYYDQAAAKKPDQANYVLASVEMKISLGQLDEARQYLLDKVMYFDQSAAIRVALVKDRGPQRGSRRGSKVLPGCDAACAGGQEHPLVLRRGLV